MIKNALKLKMYKPKKLKANKKLNAVELIKSTTFFTKITTISISLQNSHT